MCNPATGFEDAVASLRALANRLRTGPTNPDQAARQMFQVANELEDLAGRVLRQCYQQADEATMLEVVLSGGKLRESKG